MSKIETEWEQKLVDACFDAYKQAKDLNKVRDVLANLIGTISIMNAIDTGYVTKDDWRTK